MKFVLKTCYNRYVLVFILKYAPSRNFENNNVI